MASSSTAASGSTSRPDIEIPLIKRVGLAGGLLAALGVLAAPKAAALATLPAAQTLLDEADRLGLADERGWTTLLYLRERAFGPPTGVVDSPAFYFAPRDAWSPRAELHATVTQLLGASAAYRGDPDNNPLCRFPARVHWLQERLPGFAARLVPVRCPAAEAWYNSLRTEKVSLVFSSYFADNPASMFGHSFLRLHRRPLPGVVASDMLDETLNFMAYPTTANPVLYALMGLAGQFPGRFSTLPFYMKIQEYNNAESRDLWEYELDFNAAELAYLHQVIWEIGHHEINYYYFDENCSLILLMVLEAAKPSVHLPTPHPWVIPSDTLRAVLRPPGFVRHIGYRPSALSRFRAGYGALADAERQLVDAIVEANDPAQARAALGVLTPAAQARVADVAVDYIDFSEKLAGSKEAKQFAALRRELLAERAALRLPRALPAPATPTSQAPHLSRGTTRLGATAGYSPEAGGIAQAEWRPALHDLGSPDTGYAHGLAISFFETSLRYTTATRRLALHRYMLFTVLSAPDLEAVTNPYAWSLEVGADQIDGCAVLQFACYVEYGRVGVGPVQQVGEATLYGLAKAEAGGSGIPGLPLFAGAGATLGAAWPLAPDIKLMAEATRRRRFGPDRATADETIGEASGAWLLDSGAELRLTWRRRPAASEAALSYFYFY